MIDWRLKHIQRATELQDQGWRLVAENVSNDEFILRSRRKEFRPFSIWLYAGGEVYSPPQGTSNDA